MASEASPPALTVDEVLSRPLTWPQVQDAAGQLQPTPVADADSFEHRRGGRPSVMPCKERGHDSWDASDEHLRKLAPKNNTGSKSQPSLMQSVKDFFRPDSGKTTRKVSDVLASGIDESETVAVGAKSDGRTEQVIEKPQFY